MGITNEFDSVFEKFRGSIPLSFLRALAFTQSGMNPKKSVKGSAGLFMISEPALAAFDKKYPNFMPPSPHKLTALADPSLNTAIATWIINNIVTYFANRYPKTMSENWNDPTYAAVIAHGFNVGYSEPQGIGAAIKKLEANPDKFSLESLGQIAKELKLEPRKYDPNALNRAKTIANLYVADLGGKAPVNAPSTVTQPKGGGTGILMAIPVVGLVAYVLTRKK